MALSKKEMIFIGLGALLLVGVSAGASAQKNDGAPAKERRRRVSGQAGIRSRS